MVLMINQLAKVNSDLPRRMEEDFLEFLWTSEFPEEEILRIYFCRDNLLAQSNLLICLSRVWKSYLDADLFKC